MDKDKTDRKDLQPIADIDKIIHEPARYMLMSYLYVVASADFVFLMHETGLTRATSPHT